MQLPLHGSRLKEMTIRPREKSIICMAGEVALFCIAGGIFVIAGMGIWMCIFLRFCHMIPFCSA